MTHRETAYRLATLYVGWQWLCPGWWRIIRTNNHGEGFGVYGCGVMLEFEKYGSKPLSADE